MDFASLSLRPFAQPLRCRNRCIFCIQENRFSGRKMLKSLCLPMKHTSFCYSLSAYMKSKEVVDDKLLIDCGPDQECVIVKRRKEDKDVASLSSFLLEYYTKLP
ncbi:unnamed protein product [Victoria cruziana]